MLENLRYIYLKRIMTSSNTSSPGFSELRTLQMAIASSSRDNCELQFLTILSHASLNQVKLNFSTSATKLFVGSVWLYSSLRNARETVFLKSAMSASSKDTSTKKRVGGWKTKSSPNSISSSTSWCLSKEMEEFVLLGCKINSFCARDATSLNLVSAIEWPTRFSNSNLHTNVTNWKFSLWANTPIYSTFKTWITVNQICKPYYGICIL